LFKALSFLIYITGKRMPATAQYVTEALSFRIYNNIASGRRMV